MPIKQGDPGAYVLPVRIANQGPLGALADLGAGPCLMPLSIAKRLPYKLHPTLKTIQLADRTLKSPSGQLIDVPIMVGHVLVPCDFIVMEMEEDPFTPLILGRGALKTLGALVDMKNDTITIEVAQEKVVFEFSKMLRKPMVEKACTVNVLESKYKSIEGMVGKEDALYEAISGGLFRESEEDEENVTTFKEVPPSRNKLGQPVGTSGKEERSTPPPEVNKTPPPPSSECSMLENENLPPFEVDANLDDTSSRLIELLKENTSVMRCSIDDTKGKDPNLGVNCVTLRDGQAIVIDPQGRSNPTPKEIVDKDGYKLHEMGTLYSISRGDSGSPIHVLVKDGGMVMIERFEKGVQFVQTNLSP